MSKISRLLKLVGFFFLFDLRVLNGQSISLINYKTQTNCTSNERYDTRQLQCIACENDTIASSDHLSCICPSGFIFNSNGCQQCPPGQQVSPDGKFCLECNQPQNLTISSADTDYCSSCPTGYLRSVILSSQNTPTSFNCLPCPENYKSSSDGTYCVPCNAVDAVTCDCQRDECDSGDLMDPESLFQIRLENGQEVESSYLRKNVRIAEKQCKLGNIDSCQHLANMCVLQNYNRDSVTACTLFESIYNGNRALMQSSVPWLFYYNTETTLELTRTNAIDAKFTFESKSRNSRLDILLVEYSLDGKYQGSTFLHDSDLLVCQHQRKPFQFGAIIEQKCTLSLEKYITKSTTSFYDFYLLFDSETGKKKLYALPIVNENIQSFGVYINRFPKIQWSRWLLTRRIFFTDNISLFYHAQNYSNVICRICEKLNIEVQIQICRVQIIRRFSQHKMQLLTIQKTADSRILPPYITIRHKEVTRKPDATVSTAFRINYFRDITKHEHDLQISMAVLGAASVLWAIVLTYSWARREGKTVIDFTIVLKLILYECDILADMFLIVIFPMAVIITFGYKAQRIPYFTLLTPDQEWSFMAYLISATVLKFIGLLDRSVHLILTKTFFIDWEHPTVVNNSNSKHPPSRDLSNTNVKLEPVIWRTYLVANEWNELQSYRKTKIAFQVLATIVLLYCIRLNRLAIIKPGFSIVEEADNVESRLSRFAVDCSLYLIIGLGQWIFHVGIMEKVFSNPFHSMIDLCSIANISVLSLTHPLHGYYIHGKSVHGHADTGIAEMNKCLQKERDNLCGERGLEPGSDLQTFIVTLSTQFRNKLNGIIDKLRPHGSNELRLTGIEATTAKMETIASAHLEMNRFLMDFIDHSNPNVNYTVRDMSFLETVLDLDFTDTSNTSCLARDKSEVAFTKTFVHGNEWIFFSFEMLLFCTISIILKSHILAAFITYLVSECFRRTISVLFTHNLVKSSFVDQRFMM